MTNIVRQSVELDVPPERLFDTYLDSRRHAAVTGAKVSISARRNSRFSAFDGVITGRTLQVVAKRLIVQSWRSASWRKRDPDSVLVLSFGPGRRKGSGRIELLHVGVPDHDLEGVTKGWRSYYWRPWRAYLEAKKAR